MKLKKTSSSLAALICAAMALPAAAAPKLINGDQVKAAKTTYVLFFLDAAKLRNISTAAAQRDIQARLDAAGEGITACFLAADVNANNINCGNGLLRLGADLFSTTIGTNHAAPIINWLAVDKDTGLDKTSNEYAINSRASVTINAPVDNPRVMHFRFNKRISQFGFNVDPYSFDADPATPRNAGKVLEGVQFIVNGQALPVRAFTTELRGDTPFVGVEDAHGFTELTVIPTGADGGGLQFKPDRYTVVPLGNF